MNVMKHTVSILCLLLSILCFSACASHIRGGNGFNGGETMTPEQLESVSNSLFGTTPEEDKETVPNDTTAHWLKSGSVYHLNRHCRYLEGKANVNSGTVAEANAAGKRKVCSTCADYVEAATETVPHEENEPLEPETDDSRETNGADAETEPATEVATEEETFPPMLTGIVYWTENGSVYHKDADCRYIRNSKHVLYGTEEDAQEAGKARACSSCG